MSFDGHRVDGRFWAFTILGTLTATMFGCFAFAISAQTTSAENASIVSVNDAIHQMELRQKAKESRELVVRARGQHDAPSHEGALVADAVR